jgi:hypothetical protein
MSETRKEGLSFLESELGTRQDDCVYVSKYYSSKSSWTHSPAWWHDIPISKIKDTECKYLHLLCKIGSKRFYHLRVPRYFFIDNLDSLCISNSKNRKVIRLHLSVGEHDRFIDLRSLGRVDFSKWLQN